MIDEVQSAPALFRHLERWVDRHRDTRGQIILTGSQLFTLMQGVTESLAGRAAILELPTLSYAEASSTGPTPLEGYRARRLPRAVGRPFARRARVLPFIRRDLPRARPAESKAVA